MHNHAVLNWIIAQKWGLRMGMALNTWVMAIATVAFALLVVEKHQHSRTDLHSSA